jgi:hypothetical protein
MYINFLINPIALKLNNIEIFLFGLEIGKL